MVPLTEENVELKGDNFKITLHAAVHKLLERRMERQGWFGEALPTAMVGVALLKHKDWGRWERDVSDIKTNLEKWLSREDFRWEYELAALGFSVVFFGNHPRAKEKFELAKRKFLKRVEDEISRYEKRTHNIKKKRRFQFFADPFYLYSSILGLKYCGELEKHIPFFREVLEKQRSEVGQDYLRVPFLETADLMVNDYDPKSCRHALNTMINIDVDNLKESEIISTLWFVQENLDKIEEVVPNEQIAIDMVKKIKHDLWNRMDYLSLGIYLSNEGVEFTPGTKELALLDELLGREVNPIFVFSEGQLEKRDKEKYKDLKKDLASEKRWKLALSILLSVCVFTAFALVVLNYAPPGLSVRDYLRGGLGITLFIVVSLFIDVRKTYDRPSKIIDLIEASRWAHWAIRSVAALMGVIIADLIF